MRLAGEFDAEIVSVDSMLVYRRMDIGTAKPSVEDRSLVPHHLIDIVGPDTEYDVGQFQKHGRRILDELRDRGTAALLVGGSGLHFRSLVDPLEMGPHDADVRTELESLSDDVLRERLLQVDPQAGDHVDVANPRRVIRALEVAMITGDTPSLRADRSSADAVRGYEAHWPFSAFGFDPGQELRGRIDRRFDKMMEAGFLDEVAELDHVLSRTARQAVGYRQLLDVVHGECSIEEGVQRAKSATWRLARQQRTYFGRDPRVRWQPWQSEVEPRVSQLLRALEQLEVRQ